MCECSEYQLKVLLTNLNSRHMHMYMEIQCSSECLVIVLTANILKGSFNSFHHLFTVHI